MPRVDTPTCWNDLTGRAIYRAIEARRDPHELPYSAGTISWYIIWMVHQRQIVMLTSRDDVPYRLWDEHVDGDRLVS